MRMALREYHIFIFGGSGHFSAVRAFSLRRYCISKQYRERAMHHVNPYGEDRPCWLCEHWGGWDSSGCYAVCTYDNHITIKQAPQHGCAMWVRAIGADDEDDKQRAKG